MRNATSSHLIESLSRTLQALILLTALTMWYTARATAEDFGGSMFSFNGFGTVGVVNSSDNKADFIASSLEPNGACLLYTSRCV